MSGSQDMMLPCPFCGCLPLTGDNVDEVSHPSNDCSALSGLWFTKAAWNTRLSRTPTADDNPASWWMIERNDNGEHRYWAWELPPGSKTWPKGFHIWVKDWNQGARFESREAALEATCCNGEGMVIVEHCYITKPATADDVGRVALKELMFAAGALVVATDSMEALREQRQAVVDAMTKGRDALAMPPADEAIVGRLREALEVARAAIAHTFSGTLSMEVYGSAELRNALAKIDDALASLPDTSATEKGE